MKLSYFPARYERLRGEGNRKYKFILSTAARDRHGEVVEQDGWNLSNYLLAGPGPVLFGHRRDVEDIIGTCEEIRVSDGGLTGSVDFLPASVNPMAERVRLMVDAGALKSASVGFIPGEIAWDEELRGFRLRNCELLEWSIVTIPANPECIITQELKDFLSLSARDTLRFLSQSEVEPEPLALKPPTPEKQNGHSFDLPEGIDSFIQSCVRSSLLPVKDRMSKVTGRVFLS